VFPTAAEKTIHEVEIYIGILIGAVTFSGSLVAFAKLSGKLGGKPLLLPARHWLNLAGLVLVILLGRWFLNTHSIWAGMALLLVMTVIALAFGVHMVMAIGGADMPVVVSMLNSYSGWAAAATGFMLGNDLLIVVGALVGSSGAILSYIMCRAMNRNFISVIAGGFGSGGGAPSARRRRRRAGRRGADRSARRYRRPAARGQERRDRAGLRHGGRAGPARGVRDRQRAARQGRRPCASPSTRSPVACPAT
jgi:NAD/NADP transhydrogenase beta subunit